VRGPLASRPRLSVTLWAERHSAVMMNRVRRAEPFGEDAPAGQPPVGLDVERGEPAGERLGDDQRSLSPVTSNLPPGSQSME